MKVVHKFVKHMERQLCSPCQHSITLFDTEPKTNSNIGMIGVLVEGRPSIDSRLQKGIA